MLGKRDHSHGRCETRPVNVSLTSTARCEVFPICEDANLNKNGTLENLANGLPCGASSRLLSGVATHLRASSLG